MDRETALKFRPVTCGCPSVVDQPELGFFFGRDEHSSDQTPCSMNINLFHFVLRYVINSYQSPNFLIETVKPFAIYMFSIHAGYGFLSIKQILSVGDYLEM